MDNDEEEVVPEYTALMEHIKGFDQLIFEFGRAMFEAGRNWEKTHKGE
jgi:hypothetical protein